MAINQEIVDRYVEHRLWLMRYEQTVARDVLEILLRGEEQAIGAIVEAYEAATAKGDLVAWSGRGIGFRRKALARSRAALSDVFSEAEESLRLAIEGVAEDGNALLAESLEEILPKPVLDELQLSRVPERQLAQMVSDQFGDRLEGSAATIANGLKEIETSTLARINGALRDGVRDGVGTRNLVSRVRKIVGAKDIMGHRVSSLVRTMVQTTANDVAGQVYRENSDIIRAEQYVATLDDRTCQICGPLDGQVFRIKDGKSTIPRPPRHPNCRCFVTPVLRDWKAMGFPDTLDPQFKRLFDDKPAQRTTWTEWVQRNPARLERAVGPTRAARVQAGEWSLKDLATRTEALNLSEIEERVNRRRAA